MTPDKKLSIDIVKRLYYAASKTNQWARGEDVYFRDERGQSVNYGHGGKPRHSEATRKKMRAARIRYEMAKKGPVGVGITPLDK